MLDGHSEQIQALAFSNDGRQLASASWDTSVRIWEVHTGNQITMLEGHTDHVCAVSFSSSGRMLASGSAGLRENSALIWNIREQILTANKSAKRIDDAALQTLWSQLSDEDPKVAYRAIGSLVAVPERMVALVKSRLASVVEPTSEEHIKKLIRDLDDDNFQTRESATVELMKLRTAAESLLRKTLTETKSLEVRYRIRLILEAKVPKSTISDAERRQLHRVIYALELIGDNNAIEQLKDLSTGYPDPAVVREAAAAVGRLSRILHH